MLTAGETITSALQFCMNIGTSQIENDADLRKKAWFFLTEFGKRSFVLAPNWWKLASDTTLSLTSGDDNLDAPADFSHWGEQGQLYLQLYPAGPLRWEEPEALYALRRQIIPNTGRGRPLAHTLKGRSSTGTPLIQVWPTADVTYALTADNYVKKVMDFVDRPVACAAESNGAGVMTGDYQWSITFVTASGETEAGVLSTVLPDLATEQALLTNVPVSPCRSVTSRKVYRTTAGGDASTLGLVGTISNNVATTFNDNVPDGSLGAAPPTPSQAVTGTEQFPDDMIETVFVRGIVVPFATAQGDLRDNKFRDEWEKDIKRYWGEFKQGNNFPKSFPRFGQVQNTATGRVSVRYRFNV